MSPTLSVQANPTSAAGWRDLAERLDTTGCRRLYVADHPGSSASPFVALAAAAAVTERIELGTCVVNTGMWDPLDLASAVAALDVLSDGRAVLGLGAGHTPHEWTSRGLDYPEPRQRVDRLREMVDAVAALLASDAPVTTKGEHLALEGARLEHPRPIRQPIPMLIGGAGPRVLRLGAERGDIVGITGLGTVLDDGHRHTVDWSTEAIEHTLDTLHATMGVRHPEVEALVQIVHVTESDADARSATEDLAKVVPGASPADLLSTPHAWIGTTDAIVAKLNHYSELGVTGYVIREEAIVPALDILDLIA